MREYIPKQTRRAKWLRQLKQENSELAAAGLRKCPRCLETKPLEGSYNKPNGYCADCLRALGRKWAAGHRQESRVVAREHRIRTNNERPLYFMYARARCRAKKLGLEFSISYEDLLPLPKTCPVFGTELRYASGPLSDSSASLDRTDNRAGYVPGNVAVISWRANRLKLNATAGELEAIAEWMRSRGCK